ncbi:MAG: ATP-dependent DNA helicase RecQ, partial [Oxalobacteraceae bacterium]
DMARQKPTTPDALRNVSGVGERKLQLFGRQFLATITGYVRGRVQAGEKPKGSTQLQTLDLFNQGMTIEEIAVERTLKSSSIASHLVQLARAGYDIDLVSLLDPTDRREIEKAIREVGLEEGLLKPVFEHLNGRYDYAKLTLVVGLMEQ